MKTSPTLPLMCLLLGGCATSPSINVLGAFFPDWMFCIVNAIVAVTLMHVALRSLGRRTTSTASMFPLASLALTTILALVAWLTFFKN